MPQATLIKLTSITRDWLTGSVLESSADSLVAHLAELGYAARTVNSYLGCAAHFAHWVARQQVHLDHLGEGLISRFLDEHLPNCDCAARCRRERTEVRAALSHLLVVLQANGLIAEKPPGLPTAITAELDGFGAYLTDVHGLRRVTRVGRVRHVRDFLLRRFGDVVVEVDAIEPADIRDFILSYTAGWKAASVGVVGTSLRSYLRYKATLGFHTCALIAALPRVAQWRLASLPKALSVAEVETFLGAFDRNTVGGRRDYAIACCHLDLALRTSEIAQLQLDDIDWRKAVVYVRGKSRRTDVLPLPNRTGQAIMAYLRNGRRKSASRALFQRLHAPLDKPIHSSTLRAAVCNAALRCGLEHRLTGPHVLRHTVASQLVLGGASLKEIADLLRHRGLDTTAIYAKVDVVALAAVAAPWPGSRA